MRQNILIMAALIGSISFTSMGFAADNNSSGSMSTSSGSMSGSTAVTTGSNTSNGVLTPGPSGNTAGNLSPNITANTDNTPGSVTANSNLHSLGIRSTASNRRLPANANILVRGSVLSINQGGNTVTVKDSKTGNVNVYSIRDAQMFTDIELGDNVEIFSDSSASLK